MFTFGCEARVQVLIMEAKLIGGLSRPVLADVTNQIRKRAIDGFGGKMSDLKDLPVTKQVCLGLENLGRHENFSKKCLPPPLSDEVRKHSFGSLSVAGEAEGAAAVKDLPVNDVIVEDTYDSRHVIELDVVSQDSCILVPLIHLGSDSCNGDSGSGLMSWKTVIRTPASGLPLENDDKNIPVDYFSLEKSESGESAKSVKPSRMHSFELERCTSLKEDNGSNSSASAADMLKTCSCSFCLKAAYIWSDLHYQDVNGRISAAKKSIKEAVNMFQKICTVKETINSYGQGISDKTSKLESDLSSQWRSLFLHMEEAFARERNHLQDNFVALKDLRENCKVIKSGND